MIISYLLSEKLNGLFKQGFIKRLLIFFVSGLLVGGILEVIAVGLGWWTYKPISIEYGRELIYVVTGTVTLGWGIIFLLNLSISTILYPNMKKNYNYMPVLIVILFLSLFNGFIAWYLIRYGVFPALGYIM